MEEEYYRIHVWSNRCDYECFDFKEEFNKNVYEEQNFSLKFEIEVYTSETEKRLPISVELYLVKMKLKNMV